MADFNALQAIINAYIKRNGVQAITGQILNGVLTGMVNALGKGYTVAGAASPTTDPGTMTGPLAYIAYTAGTYTHFDNIVVEQGEVSMLIYNEAEWHKEVLFSLAAQATVDANVGTPAVGVSFVDGVLTFDFRNMKGNPGNDGLDGDPAGFGTISASISGGVGTPGVSVQSSGPDTAKNIAFKFTNLKGETGVTSCVVTVDNTTGNPSCAVSLVGQELHLDFSGLKGAQGDTGSSVDYPFTIVNNLTTDDPTQALSAAMGVQLESEVSQLEAKVDGLDLDVNGLNETVTGWGTGYISTNQGVGNVCRKNVNVDTQWRYVNLSVNSLFTYVVNGQGGGNPRLWAFLDANDIILAASDANLTSTDDAIKLTPPVGATQLIINSKNNDNCYVRYTGMEQKLQPLQPLPGKVEDVSFRDNFLLLNSFIGGWNIDANGWLRTASATRVGLREFRLNAGDKIIVKDGTKCRMYVGWQKADNTYGYQGWLNSTFTATDAGIYVILLEGTPSFTVVSTDDLTKYIEIQRTVFATDDISLYLKDIKTTGTHLPIVPSNNPFPTCAINYDSANDRIELRQQIVIGGLDNSTSIYTTTAVTLTPLNITAQIIVFNSVTNTFSVRELRPRLLQTDVIIASFRKVMDAPSKSSFSTVLPWSIDGKPFGINVKERGFVKGINHRGYSNIAPENTLPAFKLSAKMGFIYVETDVRFTSDNVGVLLHNTDINTTGRNPDGTAIGTTIYIWNITYADTQNYDFGIYKGAEYAGTKLPSFEQFIALCRNLGLSPYVELKDEIHTTQTQVESLVDIVKRFGMVGKVSWISYDATLLGYVSNYDDEARIGLLANSVTSEIIATAETLKTGKNEVFVDSGTYTSEEIALCSAANLPLEVYTINNEAVIAALDAYISGVTSDNKDASVILYQTD